MSDSVTFLVPKVSLMGLPICLPLNPVLQCYGRSIFPFTHESVSVLPFTHKSVSILSSTHKNISVLLTTHKSFSVLSTTLKNVPVSAPGLTSFFVCSVDLSLPFARLNIIESGLERPFEMCSLVNILLKDDSGLLYETLNYIFIMKLFNFSQPTHMLSLHRYMFFCCLIRLMTVKCICKSIKCGLM